MAARKTTTPNPNNIPEEGIELLPLEESTVPDAVAATPETAPALQPLNTDNVATTPAYGQNTSAPTPATAPAVKATTVSSAPLWIAGGLLSAGGIIAAVAKGGSSGSKNHKDGNNGYQTVPSGNTDKGTNNHNTHTDNSHNGQTAPSTNAGNHTPPPPQPNHMRVVYGYSQSPKITRLQKWQDLLTFQGKKVTVAESEILKQYIQKYGKEKIQQNIEKAYQSDRDGDGIIDRHDSKPDKWNVSDRDLREFTTLSYGNRGSMSEFKNKWTVLKQGSPGSGLNYTVFGNGKHADGHYENIVVAFRGTEKTSPKDWVNDLQLMNGNLPNQAGYLNGIADEIMTKYRPANVYSTGHSLGGYLAQFFAVNSMAQTTAHKQAFKHSALFNPAILKTDGSSPDYLYQARSDAEKFARTPQPNRSDLSESPKDSYKTNSYVITGEWVSSGFNEKVEKVVGAGVTAAGTWAGASAGASIGSALMPGIGTVVGGLLGGVIGFFGGKKAGEIVNDTMSFKGMGSYENSIFFDFKQNTPTGYWWGKHDLKTFYEHDAKLQKYFSTGYRTDYHYQNEDADRDGLTYVQEKHIGLNPHKNSHGTDSDKDGFSDALEVKLGSNLYHAGSRIDLKNYYTIQAAEKIRFAVAGEETVDGKVLDTFGVELRAQVQNNQLHYTPSGTSTVTLGINNAEWKQWLTQGGTVQSGTENADTLHGNGKAAVLYGGTGNDILTASSGLDIMVGGAGNDTFRFSTAALNRDKSPDLISDFGRGDRLDLNGMRSLFADHGNTFRFADILSDSSSPLFTKHSALVWNGGERTLSYKTAGSDTLHAFVRFDDEQSFNAIQTGLLA